MSHRLLTAPALAATALLLAACGSSGSSSSASTHSSATSGQPAASTSSAAAAAGPYASGAYGAASSSSAAPSATGVTITTKPGGKLGTILAAGGRAMTVYLFKADHGGQSACTGACASVWPPVTGTPHAAGGALAADLGTVRRSDGTLQVTYKGQPLYRYVKDGDAHDAYGAGIKEFGAPWYALAPSGHAVDNS